MKSIKLFVFIPVLLTLACNIPFAGTVTPTPTQLDLNATIFALSIQLTETAMNAQISVTETSQPSATIRPSDTPQPTASQTPSMTNTPEPCNLAGNVIDVTYSDGTKVDADSIFIKTWRITNYGTCTWTSGYSLVFSDGDRMDAPGSVQLTTGTVVKGNSVDVSVQLTAPHAKGTYRGNYKLRAPDGTIFGIGTSGSNPFWVEIKVPAPTAQPLSDLKITQLESCASPQKGVPCTIKVAVYNSGDVNINTPFDLYLYVGSATTPKCSWNIPSLVKNGGQVKSCSYTFPSWYGSISLTGVADETNVIPENNEGNNSSSITISVAP